MSINRYNLVTRHNPKLSAVDFSSPLSVGNGDFVFTADVTGLQSLSAEYRETFPLCTMAHWGVHTLPATHARYLKKEPQPANQPSGVRQGGTPTQTTKQSGISFAGPAASAQPTGCDGTACTVYTLSELSHTAYPYLDRTVTYPVHCAPGEEPIYTWLRENPHRANLAEIGLRLNGQAVTSARLSNISQELDLYTGVIHSTYSIGDTAGMLFSDCSVKTVCDGDSDTVAFQITSDALPDELTVCIAFPFGSPEKSGGIFPAPDEDQEELILYPTENSFFSEFSDLTQVLTLRRRQNNDSYFVTISTENGTIEPGPVPHTYCIRSLGDTTLSFAVSFDKNNPPVPQEFETVSYRSAVVKKKFWETGAAIDFSRCKDPQAKELERRMILSEYLLSIQSAGSLPPPETGLTCNSWYGKFHLEMHPWHAAWLPLWGHGDLLKKSLTWYELHLPEARENAAKNGFAGARWPKMVGETGMDSPSVIAPLLIWQQPHLIFMCELLYQTEQDEEKKKELLLRYFPLLKETADFMADFGVYDSEKDVYVLLGPMIPAQECHKPADTKNPTFEAEYWYYGLKTAAKWGERLESFQNNNAASDSLSVSSDHCRDTAKDNRIPPDSTGIVTSVRTWNTVADKLYVPSPDKNGLYPAHENCPDTFTKYNEDHPSMLCAYGLLYTGRLDRNIAANTLGKVEDCWDYNSLWGWDFAVLAMTALRLGDCEHALSLLLSDTPKNRYVTNGHNNQEGDSSLPLYLPGNGSLLLALAMFAGGFPGAKQHAGFPKNGLWDDIEIEGFDTKD
ncbi:MAG: glycoside hydrolase family 65 [Lachnospiraceae bacterium]|nr:glycoside hydrolase family 65 [Lachnospiraceae bacterium]